MCTQQHRFIDSEKALRSYGGWKSGTGCERKRVFSLFRLRPVLLLFRLPRRNPDYFPTKSRLDWYWFPDFFYATMPAHGSGCKKGLFGGYHLRGKTSAPTKSRLNSDGFPTVFRRLWYWNPDFFRGIMPLQKILENFSKILPKLPFSLPIYMRGFFDTCTLTISWRVPWARQTPGTANRYVETVTL